MSRIPFDEMAAFALVAERKSFGKAALELGVSRSALSHAVRTLEERLGIRLLNRTTRSVAPTEAGERLLARLRPALAEIGFAVEEINAFRDTLGGSLRLTVLSLAAQTVIAPMLARFLAAYPAIQVEISVDNALRDIVRDRFDAGIRPGERVERDMVVVRVGDPLRPVVFAAPDYLARHGTPRTPRDLQTHECVRLRMPTSGAFLPWRFAKSGEQIEVAVAGRLIVNDAELAVRAVRDGAAVGYLVRDAVESDLAAGRLVALLEDWMPKTAELFLYYPSRRQVPAPLRAFIDFLKKERRAAAA